MPALSSDDYGVVRSALGSCEIKSTAIAKLYIASNNTWCNTGLVGAAVVCGDPNKKSYFLRLVDLRSRAVVWEQEFYQGFIYQVAAPFFHSFETDHAVAGLSFADDGEAKEFSNKVLYCKNSPYLTAEQKVQAKQNIMQAEKAVKSEAKGGEKKKKKNPFDFIGKLFKKEDPGAGFNLSGPTNFRHQSHIGWDPDKGFEINNIPPEWKQLFAAAGVKKSELKDAATAKYVMNVITDAMLADGGTPPPMPGFAPGPPVAPVAPQPHATHVPPPPPNPTVYSPPQVHSPQTAHTPPLPPPNPTAFTPTPVAPTPQPEYAPPQPVTPVAEEPSNYGAPPPPPPPTAPMPPPPPMPTTTATPTAPLPRTASTVPPATSSLMDSIRQGATLRKVEDIQPGDLKTLDSEKKKTLADTLAAAMAARRQDLDIDAAGGTAAVADDDEWSM